jgi:hypothetical protein
MKKPVDRAALEDAIKAADAIFALSGMPPGCDPEVTAMDKRVLAGELSFDQAAEEFVARAKARAAATTQAKPT